MGLRIFLGDWNEFVAKTEFGIVLEYVLCCWNEFAAKTELGIVLEYFCEFGMNLRLRQKK